MKCALAHILPDGRILNTKYLQHKSHKNQHVTNTIPIGPSDLFTSRQSFFNKSSNSIPSGNEGHIPSSTNVRNVYSSAPYTESPTYPQPLSPTPISPALTSPDIFVITNDTSDFHSSNVIGQDSPLFGSVPFIATKTPISPDYNSHGQHQSYTLSQSVSASSAALRQHRQQDIFLQTKSHYQHKAQRSLSASAAIWNSNPIPVCETPVSALINSVSNLWIGENPEFLKTHEFAIDDEGDGLEEFVPSSLTDLLTNDELQRRSSKSSSTVHPILNIVNPRISFSNGTSDIWGSNSPRTFARRQKGDVDRTNVNGDPVSGISLRSSFSISNSGNTGNGTPFLSAIGTPDGGSSFIASYKSHLLANSGNQHSKSTLMVGVGSSVLSDDGVTGVLTPSSDQHSKSSIDDDFVTSRTGKPSLEMGTKYANGSSTNDDDEDENNSPALITSSVNDSSEFDEIQFQMD